jgi:hypothetical protein
MTPKEKAIELIDKFKLKHKFFTNSFIKTTAKQCVLIAVDEILYITEHESPSTYVYYVKVKQEIESL